MMKRRIALLLALIAAIVPQGTMAPRRRKLADSHRRNRGVSTLPRNHHVLTRILPKNKKGDAYHRSG